MLEKCVLTVVELNWNKRLGHKKTKLNICHHMLTSSTQLQNRSFHVVKRTRTSSKCQKMKYARAKRAKILFSIVKYAHLWGFCCRRRRRGCLKIDCRNAKLHFQMTFSLPSPSCLLKLPNLYNGCLFPQWKCFLVSYSLTDPNLRSFCFSTRLSLTFNQNRNKVWNQ